MDAIQNRVFHQIRRLGRGKVFIPKDFLETGSREAIDQALGRLAKSGSIQRIGRGFYYYPNVNDRLRISIPPSIDAIAEAVARQTGSRIAPSGATAANSLGLSDQVPAKPVYLTDGRSRRVRVSNVVFTLKHVAPKQLPKGSRTSTLVVQALRYLGKDAINNKAIQRIRRTLPAKQRSRLLKDTQYTTDWIADAIRKIVVNTPEEVTRE